MKLMIEEISMNGKRYIVHSYIARKNIYEDVHKILYRKKVDSYEYWRTYEDIST